MSCHATEHVPNEWGERLDGGHGAQCLYRAVCRHNDGNNGAQREVDDFVHARQSANRSDNPEAVHRQEYQWHQLHDSNQWDEAADEGHEPDATRDGARQTEEDGQGRGFGHGKGDHHPRDPVGVAHGAESLECELRGHAHLEYFRQVAQYRDGDNARHTRGRRDEADGVREVKDRQEVATAARLGCRLVLLLNLRNDARPGCRLDVLRVGRARQRDDR
mmetsp:Transcript_70194/g.215075  ORF Transcript_70194/g.215075 Transcript_70194/m.215075 type:complete len:218 (+) Transcript_70194:278-931(+)